MANNRMFLKCGVCGEVFHLAKYYPTPGWYVPRHYHNRSLNDFLDAHMHDAFSGVGPRHFELGYEHAGESAFRHTSDTD
jgi:hypothetical protein